MHKKDSRENPEDKFESVNLSDLDREIQANSDKELRVVHEIEGKRTLLSKLFIEDATTSNEIIRYRGEWNIEHAIIYIPNNEDMLVTLLAKSNIFDDYINKA